jgi:hypothetical protein
MAYDLVWEDNGVYWKYSGNVTGKEIIDASTTIYGDARFITLKYKFADFTDVEDFKMDKSQLALIAYQHLAAERSNPYLKNVILIKQAIRSRRWRMNSRHTSTNQAGKL